jgi:hypothetical protein
MKTPALGGQAEAGVGMQGVRLGRANDDGIPHHRPSAPPATKDAALHERAVRFRRRLEQPVPPQLAFRFSPGSAATGRLLSLLFDSMEDAGDSVLKLHHGAGLPAVMFCATTGRWSCTSGWASGTGVIELATWARDREIIGTAALAYVLRPLLRAPTSMRTAA